MDYIQITGTQLDWTLIGNQFRQAGRPVQVGRSASEHGELQHAGWLLVLSQHLYNNSACQNFAAGVMNILFKLATCMDHIPLQDCLHREN